MFQSIIDFVGGIDWSSYPTSVFQILLVTFALLKRFNILSLLILGVVLGTGLHDIQQHTNFSGSTQEMFPFILYSFFSFVFFIYAMIKLFTRSR